VCQNRAVPADLGRDVQTKEVLLSPYLAVSMLAMFQRKAIPRLTEERYYEAVDALVQLLEDANDEKYRLIPKEEE